MCIYHVFVAPFPSRWYYQINLQNPPRHLHSNWLRYRVAGGWLRYKVWDTHMGYTGWGKTHILGMTNGKAWDFIMPHRMTTWGSMEVNISLTLQHIMKDLCSSPQFIPSCRCCILVFPSLHHNTIRYAESRDCIYLPFIHDCSVLLLVVVVNLLMWLIYKLNFI